MRSAACLGVALFACVHPIEEETSTVGVVTRDCQVPLPTGVAELGAAVSLAYPDGALFVWESVTQTDGTLATGLAAFVDSAESLCATAPVLQPFLTPEEGVALRPTGGFVHDGTGYLFYERWRGFELLETALCLVPPGELRCEPQPFTLPPSARVLNQGGLVDGDRALVYGCRAVAAFSRPCVVNGAPLDRLTDPAAYQVWNVFSGWGDDLVGGSVLVDELGSLSVSRDGERFVATSIDPFEGRVRVRFSASARGDFGRPIDLFSLPASGAREHAGLRREPRTLHLTYVAEGLRLVSFRFHGDVE